MTGAQAIAAAPAPAIGFFERYLSVWVALCIVAGIGLGQWLPGLFKGIAALELAQVNVPVGVLIWVMIIPMLLKIDFAAMARVREHARGVGVTLFINWAVKPFSMALLGSVFIGWLFIVITVLLWGRGVFCGWICPFGSLSEMLHKVGHLVGLKRFQFAVPQAWHHRMKWVKYGVFAGLLFVLLRDDAAVAAEAAAAGGSGSSAALWLGILLIVVGVVYLLVAKGLAGGNGFARLLVGAVTIVNIAAGLWLLFTHPGNARWSALGGVVLGVIVLAILYSPRASAFFRTN